MSKFAQYKVAAATYDGKSYSLPFDSGVAGLFYRSDYLEQAGYKPEDLQDITWDKLIEIGKAVKDKTGHQLIDVDYNDDGIIIMMMQSTGQWYLKDGNEPNIIDNPALKASLDVFQKMAQAGLIKPVSGWTDYTGAFTSGEIAMVPQGVWITGTIKSMPDQSGKWRVAPLPKLDGIDGATHYSNNGGSSWYVLASSQHTDEAVDFLKTVWANDVDFYQGILVNQGAVGSLLAATISSTASRSGRTSPIGWPRCLPSITAPTRPRRGWRCGRRCPTSPRAAISTTPSRPSTRSCASRCNNPTFAGGELPARPHPTAGLNARWCGSP
jgi:lactose/L-arabinose transport system substrate-binding protein